MYDPSIGRWLEEDPLGFEAGDANLYRYVGNGPTNGVDPSGLDQFLPPGLVPQDGSSSEEVLALWFEQGYGTGAIIEEELLPTLAFLAESGTPPTIIDLNILWAISTFKPTEPEGADPRFHDKLNNIQDTAFELLVGFWSSGYAPPVVLDEEINCNIANLINQLGSETFVDRIEAQNLLREINGSYPGAVSSIGIPVYNSTDDPEIRHSLSNILFGAK